MDIISKEKRSWNMSRIRSKDTKPEKIVRFLLHRMGYRFRLHVNNLPGKPDIVLPKYRTVIFVHGCFWHRHKGCKYAYTPKSRIEFWEKKFADNIERFKSVKKELINKSWKVIVIWECETKFDKELESKLQLIFDKKDGILNHSCHDRNCIRLMI
jgi:DNA mismatch endonuclease (patch repair protein)